ncbi:hypothetical protein LACWKB10_0645 [Lactobacillus sp. wkB10]|nr:hypothetical protein LACWKB10_0645 [Lactobacillus sp. wkB10]
MVSNFIWCKRLQLKTPILKKLLKIPMLLLYLFKTVGKQKENLFVMFARLLLTAIAILTS